MMNVPVFSKKRANTISNGILLIAFGILILTNTWWPGIFLAIWATLASRQFLSGRYYYALLSSFVLISLFFIAIFKYEFSVLAPILLICAGIFIAFREYYFTEDTNGEEKSEEIKEDVDLD